MLYIRSHQTHTIIFTKHKHCNNPITPNSLHTLSSTPASTPTRTTLHVLAGGASLTAKTAIFLESRVDERVRLCFGRNWQRQLVVSACRKQFKHVAGQFALNQQADTLDPQWCQFIRASQRVRVAFDELDGKGPEKVPGLIAHCAVGVESQSCASNAVSLVLLIVLVVLTALSCLRWWFGHPHAAVVVFLPRICDGNAAADACVVGNENVSALVVVVGADCGQVGDNRREASLIDDLSHGLHHCLMSASLLRWIHVIGCLQIHVFAVCWSSMGRSRRERISWAKCWGAMQSALCW